MNSEILVDPSSIRNLALVSIQGLNANIYGNANQIYFDPMRMAARVARFGGRLHKAVRVGDQQAIEYHLTMTFSWSLGLANKLGFVLENRLWSRFPGVCSHCKLSPCGCGKGGRAILDGQAILPGIGIIEKISSPPLTLRDFQKMFKGIYPDNNINSEAGHTVEEICEVLEAVDNFTGTARKEFHEDSIVELTDVGAHLIGVANCNNKDMALLMERHFGSGCYQCHKVPCICEFPATRTISPHKK